MHIQNPSNIKVFVKRRPENTAKNVARSCDFSAWKQRFLFYLFEPVALVRIDPSIVSALICY